MNQPVNRVFAFLRDHPRVPQGMFGSGLGAAITAEYTRGRPNRRRKVLIGAAVGSGMAALKPIHADKVFEWAGAIFG